MKYIKGKLDGLEVYFVNMTPAQGAAWSPRMEDAAHFCEEDSQEILHGLMQQSENVEDIVLVDATNIGFIYNEELAPAIVQLNREFRNVVVTPENIFTLIQRFSAIIEHWGFSDEYLTYVKANIKNNKITFNLPPNAEIIRTRTLH